jgi:hypothetical protein
MLILLTSIPSIAQDGSTPTEILTNEKVVNMVQAGLPGIVIVNKIRASKTNFDTSNAGSSINGSVTADRNGSKEIGVYLKKDNEWIEIQPEVVNWKTGGVGKHIISLGVVKQDVNGHIDGKGSRTLVSSPLEFMIVTPEGVAITEYQLIKLNQNSDNREFRTMTGGVFHAKGGATKDVVPFEAQKVASRTFTITLTGTKAGEYGFLPPGALTQASGAATLGKMYTFSVIPMK